MKAISNETRELLVAAKKRGEKESDFAVWLKINVRSVRKIWRLCRETESIQPKARLGRKSSIDAATITRIQNAVKQQPDTKLQSKHHERSS